MQVIVNIKKDKRAIYCGHVSFMHNILVEHGRSYKEVEEKIKGHLQSLFEMSNDAFELKIRPHHTVKAINGMRRLKGQQKNNSLQVSFNSRYFI